MAVDWSENGGCSSTSVAGCRSGRAAFIACAFVSIHRQCTECMDDACDAKCEFDVPAIGAALAAAGRAALLLTVAGREDRETPFAGAVEIMEAWPGSELVEDDRTWSPPNPCGTKLWSQA